MLKKVLALALAGAMVLGSMSMSAFGAVGEAKVNSTLTVSGLDKGDTVTYYKVLTWGPNEATPVDGISDGGNLVLIDGTPTGWIWGEGVNSDNLTLEDFKQLIGTKDGTGQITGALASKIASNLGTAAGSNMPLSGADYWEVKNKEAGLYMVIVTPASADTIYNPIFVAANWYVENEGPDSSNSIAIKTSEPSYYDKAMAKKSKLPLEKVAEAVGTDTDANNSVTDTNGLNDDNPTTGDVGETYEFKVTNTIPRFAANYTNPVYTLKDTLSDGLELDTTSIKVFAYDETAGTWSEMNASYYDKTPAATKSGWTITFKPDYLKSNNIPANGQKIKVTYLAKVTNDAQKIVNQDTNDVDLIFSTTPSDTEGHGVLRRETNHFTFSIDADLFGNGEWQDSSNEAIKVGIDKDGNPIVSTSTDYWGGTTHAPLEGAEFELWKGDGSGIYKNDNWPDGVKVKSDATGRITITGLDQGTYKLRETKAPAGYVKLQDDVDVEITAVIKTDRKVEEEVEDGSGAKVPVTYETNYVESYTVTIGGSTTKYTMELKKSDSEIEKVNRDTTTVQSSDKELANTKGVELPSTGGIGTTIFYMGGAVLVLLAGVLLVSKRRVA